MHQVSQLRTGVNTPIVTADTKNEWQGGFDRLVTPAVPPLQKDLVP
jgi:hypothetical protein